MSHDNKIDITGDVPMERDCPNCGTHHVIDPVKVRALLDQAEFQCGQCGDLTDRRLMRSLVILNGEPWGVCRLCDDALFPPGSPGLGEIEL